MILKLAHFLFQQRKRERKAAAAKRAEEAEMAAWALVPVEKATWAEDTPQHQAKTAKTKGRKEDRLQAAAAQMGEGLRAVSEQLAAVLKIYQDN